MKQSIKRRYFICEATPECIEISGLSMFDAPMDKITNVLRCRKTSLRIACHTSGNFSTWGINESAYGTLKTCERLLRREHGIKTPLQKFINRLATGGQLDVTKSYSLLHSNF